MNPAKIWEHISRLKKPNRPLLGVSYHAHNLPAKLSPKCAFCTRVELENAGEETWQLHHPLGNPVDLFVRWDAMVAGIFPMPRAEVRPGERVTIHFALRAPAIPGKHELEVDLVKQNVAFFSERGSQALRRSIEVMAIPSTANSELFDFAARVNPWHYQPTQGVDGAEGAEPAFPLFVSRASGYHLWDLTGRQYIDYIMGWGCALLGYAPAVVQRAIAAELDSAAVVPFPHPREMQVARMLTEDIACAEMVVFGKNGSDACTVAARLARVFTGRRTLLFSGYHGWQDWWMEQLGFAASGVPEYPQRLIHRFRFNDLADFRRLFEQHRADLAGVMLEPAGPVEGTQGPSHDADAAFLAAVGNLTREAGGLLIYDEIMTGFRYPGGSVQAATGVVPDLTCLGKALGGGLSLSALVGRARIMERAMRPASYAPTFKGEVYPFAAACAALEIYRREPVAEHVWRFGQRLQEGMTSLAVDHGVAATSVGPPFRTALAFTEPNPERLRLKRTLYQQELLRAGISTYNGFMLPSYAHDEAALEATLAAVDSALKKLAAAERSDNFNRYIRIPLLP
jgi:glutamate-1-semialdehyde 2,1-aminomutase